MAKKRIIVKLNITDLPGTGGKVRAAKLSAEELSAAGAKIVKACWENTIGSIPRS